MMFPALNPIEAPALICTECGQEMRRVISVHRHTSKLDKIQYFCDTEKCRYGMEISKEHKNAQTCQYIPPPPEPETTVAQRVAQSASAELLDRADQEGEEGGSAV